MLRRSHRASMFAWRVVLALLALLIALPASAASVAERSPFAQGLWWDPGRSGNGFEIFNTADQVAVLWFTYTEAGRPTWYTAVGHRESLGNEAWPLLQHRWSGGRVEDPVVVGSLRLNVRHPEVADVTWNIGDKQGTWAIRPLTASGVVSEIDHSGVWFDPANSGWGISLSEQGDFLGAVVYTYDAAGTPTWIAAFERGSAGDVEFHSYGGACPGCAQRPSTPTSVGRLAFDMRSETDLVLNSRLNVAMAPGVKLNGARVTQLGRKASSRPADRQLASFNDEAALRAHLAEGMLNVPSPHQGISFSAPPSPIMFSPTNLQESGVDEPDLVKSNGHHLYTFAHDSNGVRKALVRVAQVGDDGATLAVGAAVSLGSGSDTSMESAGLFLNGDRLVSVTGTRPYVYSGSPWAQSGSWMRGVTHIEVLSTSNPDVPTTRWRAAIDGHIVGSRRIGDRVYVVSRFVPYLDGFAYGTTHPPLVATNQQILAAKPLGDLLPKVRIDGGDARAAVAATAVHAPPQGSRSLVADMILITAVDLTGPRIAQSLAIVGSAETVFASNTSLYVAGSRHESRDAIGLPLPIEHGFPLTDLHQIRLGANGMAVVGSASIEGVLGDDVDKAPLRLSESQGRLRAVTSSTAMWGGESRNRLTILEPSTLTPGLLKTTAYLPNPRRPQTLGKPNEILYGVRFHGDRLYAVTFRRIDPLYVVDLANSADPRIAGTLEVPGFSDYLHPLPNKLLLGFGKDARPADVSGDGTFAWFQGLQLTLFDVSNPDQPRELQRVLMGKRGSDSALLRHHHAFSALSASDGALSIGIPARIHDGVLPPNAGDADYYPWQYSGLMRFDVRGTGASDARIVQLPSLVTHTPAQGPVVFDAAGDDARSVLYGNGSVYVSKGWFWRQDSAGNVFGPY